MLLVSTRLGPSRIEGIGLFAAEPVRKGQAVWKFVPGFDLLLSKNNIAKLSKPAQDQFYHYAYVDRKFGKYVLCSDDARFLNHSESPNCDDSDSFSTVALRDIPEGEELTVNYGMFYGNMDEHPEITLKGRRD